MSRISMQQKQEKKRQEEAAKRHQDWLAGMEESYGKEGEKTPLMGFTYNSPALRDYQKYMNIVKQQKRTETRHAEEDAAREKEYSDIKKEASSVNKSAMGDQEYWSDKLDTSDELKKLYKEKRKEENKLYNTKKQNEIDKKIKALEKKRKTAREFVGREGERIKQQSQAEAALSKRQAFSKLSDVDALKQRQAELSQTAQSGLSLQQKQAEKAQVGAAIRGQQKSIGRRMQSILGGQGMRGAAASSVMRSIDQKAKKQSAQFEMGQMARSYQAKKEAADKKATMGMDMKQFDIGQDKAGLEFMEARRRKPLERRQQIINSLQAQGKGGATSLMSNLNTAEEL